MSLGARASSPHWSAGNQPAPGERLHKRPRWPRSQAAFLLAAITLLGGCRNSSRAPNTLMLDMQNDASTLDPAKAYDTTSIQFVRILYRGLIDYDDNANIVDEVAERHTVSKDGKTYWFKLRHDVFFQNGRPVTADDFRFAMERVLDPKTASDGLAIYKIIDGATEFSKDREDNPDNPQIAHVRGIQVKGNDEITYTLVKPDSTFLNYLALPFAYAVPRDWVENLDKNKQSLNDHPCGDGPFVLEQWVHEAWIKLKKNPHYFHPDLPKCDEIVAQVGVSPTLQLMLFEQGSNDILSLSDANPPEYLRLTHDPKWQPYIEHAPMMDIRYLCMNTEVAPFDNVLVRQAMNYAIDRGPIASFQAGRATIARGALPPGMPGYNPHLFQYPYDPDKAKALLKQAGFHDDPNNAPVLWYSNQEPWYDKAAQSIKQNLSQVGMTINLKIVTYAELKAQAGKRHNIPLSIMGWIQDFPDPSNFLQLFNGENITDTSSLNRAFYENKKLDKLLDDAGVELNHDKRLKMYQEAEAGIVQDAPWVFLTHTERYVVHQPWIKGYTLNPMWNERYEFVSVEGK